MKSRQRFLTTLLVGLGLLIYWLMAVSVSPHMGVTADEVVHLTGGYTYWKYNDYRMHPENGTLPMRIAALPWLFSDVKPPPLTDPTWLESKVNLYGQKLFFESGNPIDQLLWRSRMMIGLIGAFTVWLTWRWARGLFGTAAGRVALALAVFCPAMLAHGGLATSDMTMTACVLAALSAVWLLLHRASWLRLILAIVACGLAFLSKMSGVLIVPLIGALLIARWLRPAPFVWMLGRQARWLRHRTQIIAATFVLTVIVAAGSLLVLWAGYGFRFSGLNGPATAPDGYYFSWDVILDKSPLEWPKDSSLQALQPERPLRETLTTHVIDWTRQHRLLPEAYLWGFAHTYKFSRYRPAFFLGDYRATGWKLFFPVAFVLKTPLPALLLILIGGGTLVGGELAARKSGSRIIRPWLYRGAPLWLFFALYWAMAVNMSLNIGHRHILPTYPIFYVIAGAAGVWLVRQSPKLRLAALAIGALLALDATDSLLARPFYLSYFQPTVGGVERGYRYLVDSSYDWGQGLPDLKRWLDAKEKRKDPLPVYLSYFGADDSHARGLNVVRFGDEMTDTGARVFPAQVHGGWFVISATHFQRVYFPTRGPWTPELEALYQKISAQLTATEHTGLPAATSARAKLLRDAMDYETLQFARLCHYLGDRPPLEAIGGSLLVFRLSDAEVQAALHGPPPFGK